ncbi:NUDIX domain-containing protein [Isoptericola sp. b441]|uniref:NUDIX domain-containing protein n=1 Tax=Actinotalea lenta TaxID=3064654 RepID=A0ABT9DCU0_9CELL|nr:MULTISPECIES: NUDIX domain-containing protein [unclassified Isoptericola]MDO8108336.1 NUDIX domain-containing protein [Isoptericola sp. b441]MDO8119736.1 NUDIX domain-containing protein [Isoptericola sp. b490]
MVYRDSSGRTLADYPRPSVAVDTAVLTVTPDGVLAVVLVRSGDPAGWRVPGTFLHPGERLADAVRRSLAQKAGITGLEPAQLHVFDAPERDDRGWVLSVAHLATVRYEELRLDAGIARLEDISAVGELRYDHSAIIEFAVAELRARYASAPDPAGLLPEPFTILELRRLHEAVAGEWLQRDTFRRAMLPGLVATGELQRGQRGKPAELFRRT